MNYLVLCSILAASTLSPVYADGNALFPTLEAETLLGKDITIPKDFQGLPVWIVIGFTKDSKKATSRCAELLNQTYKDQSYSAALLQGVPFFLKGIIKNKIRSSVPEKRWSHFLILNEGREELEKLSDYVEKSKDDAYVVGLRPKSPTVYELVFKSHGVCDEKHILSLLKMIRELTALDQRHL